MKEKLQKKMLILLPLLALLWLNYYIDSQSESYLSYITIIVLYFIIIFLVSGKNKYFNIEKLHEKRYYISSIIFIFLVVFKFHGSSIAIWDDIYVDYGKSEVEKSVYIGTPRPIRSDEWNVQTTIYLSQLMKEEKLTRINENMRSDGEDMVVASYAPVLDPTIIGKPFNWGFLFLDKERGFSWYWCLKVISLFMLSYEISLMLSKRNKKISLLGATFISLAPAMQWWFSTFVVDLIIFAQGALVATYYYFRNINNLKNKLLNLVLFSICGIGFIISLYPPIQVSLGYLCAIIFIYLIIKNKDKIKKNDIIYFLIAAIFIISIVAYFLITSKDALALMLNTVYPGARVETGGNLDFNMVNGYVISWLLPYKELFFSNQCEVSTFVSLIPLVGILFFFRKKKDEDNKLVVYMFIYMIIMFIFIVFGFPEMLSKLTLFSFIPANRMNITLGLTSIYILIILLPNIVKNRNEMKLSLASCITIITVAIIFIPQYGTDAHKYLTKIGVITSAFVLTILIYLIVRGYIKELLPYSIIFMIITGFFVNPIARTLNPIYGKEISKNIININENNPGKWVSIDNMFGATFLFANGVETFNGVHYYPDLKMWEMLDKENKYEDIYNRYAHVRVGFTNEETNFELLHADAIKVNINIDELKKTGIKYILSNSKLDEEYNTKEESYFKELYFNTVDNTYIYEYIQ